MSDSGGSTASGGSGNSGSSGDYLGSLIAGAFAVKGQKRANKFARREAQKNREWQQRMSDTSYQRGMKDMREAGLNPMLAFSQGGASSPIGSVAPVRNIYGSLPSDIAAGITSGAKKAEATIKAAKLKSELANMDSATAANHANAGKAIQDMNTSAATQARTIEETKILESTGPYRADKAFGDIPWSGKAKMGWNKMKDWAIESSRRSHSEWEGRRRAR